MLEENKLIKRFDLVELENRYKEILNLIDSVYERNKTIESISHTFFGKSGYGTIIPYDFLKHSIEDVKAQAKSSCWHYVIGRMELESFLSSQRRRELNKLIETNKIPEFGAETVSRMVAEFAYNINTLLQESAKAAYEFIKPTHTGYKTNEFSKGMPEKVILTWCLDAWYFPKVWVSGRTKDKINDLDNVFHLLDGKGPIKHPDNLATKLNESKINEIVETVYFKVRSFKNRNLHIWFKRMDLANKLAELATSNIVHS